MLYYGKRYPVRLQNRFTLSFSASYTPPKSPISASKRASKCTCLRRYAADPYYVLLCNLRNVSRVDSLVRTEVVVTTVRCDRRRRLILLNMSHSTAVLVFGAHTYLTNLTNLTNPLPNFNFQLRNARRASSSFLTLRVSLPHF